jgi:S-adenosylhomocysteine hydrolase
MKRELKQTCRDPKNGPAWPRDKGVSEETTTGVHRLYQMLKEKKRLFPLLTSTIP